MRSRPRRWSRRGLRPLELALLGASVVAAVLLLPHADGPGVPTDTRSRESGARSGVPSRARVVAPCTWSFFGDPRSVAHGDLLYTGCIGMDGTVKLERYNLDTRARHLLTLFRGLEVDDHNNPSLVFFRRKLYAFVSPHSGYLYPLNRHSTMRYRVSAHDFGAGDRWDDARTVALGKGCGLGYTYPNPVVSHKRLYLFMRGPCWYPYFTSTADGTTWAKPKTLVLGPPSTGRNIRPYAKYDGARDGSILMTFSNGHPGTYHNNLYFMRFNAGRFYKADGTVIGSTDQLPFHLGQLDLVQRYSADVGGPWPLDLASGQDNTPVIVYSSRIGLNDDFRYASYDGKRWVTRRIAYAGGFLFGYRNGGITLDHSDPRWIVMSHVVRGRHEIELRFTPDHARTWRIEQLTAGSNELNFRPVIPRGVSASRARVVLYISGAASGFRSYRTVLRMRELASPAGPRLETADTASP
jgi:hypothetical protein